MLQATPLLLVALPTFLRAWGTTTHFQNELKETLTIPIADTSKKKKLDAL